MIPESDTNAVPRVWKDSAMSAIYTLTPTHCGIGQAAASVDLPIARDVATGFPVLPATSLKGVARECFEDKEINGDQKLTEALFGPSLEEREDRANKAKPLQAAGLSFTEGRLVAWPARSLNRPFLHTTCPLIIDKLVQDARLLGRGSLPKPKIKGSDNLAYVSDKELDGKALVIEDLCYAANEVLFDEDLAGFAAALAALLPPSETDTAARLKAGLVVIPDADFQDLLQRTVPVAARTLLTGGKTTDKWFNPRTKVTESGNLWYEEYLPADCLFVAFVGQRRQVYMQNDADDKQRLPIVDPIGKFIEIWRKISFVQIGGNETVGNGLCLWNVRGSGRRES